LELKDYIEENFRITVFQTVPTAKGSGNTFDVTSDTGRYIAKCGVRSDFIAIQQKIQPLLEKAGLKQARIIFHDEKVVLYEWLDGDGSGQLTPQRMRNAVLYMKKYFEVLHSLPAGEIEIKRMNAWDDAKSLDFLLDEFPRYAEYIAAPCLSAAVKRLSENRVLLSKQPKQLIHGDLGADNFIFAGDEVAAIIDFTPEIAPALYGLCHFLYWNVLWRENNPSSLHQWAGLYTGEYDHEVFDLLMIQAALFRVAGPLLNGIGNLEKRIVILDHLLEI
jgi:thiamine kinase-like enzyme